MGIRSVTVVRGDRFAWLDFTNRPVTAERTRVTKLLLGCLRAMARGYRLCAATSEDSRAQTARTLAAPFRRMRQRKPLPG
jgi:hypothetical protein